MGALRTWIIRSVCENDCRNIIIRQKKNQGNMKRRKSKEWKVNRKSNRESRNWSKQIQNSLTIIHSTSANITLDILLKLIMAFCIIMREKQKDTIEYSSMNIYRTPKNSLSWFSTSKIFRFFSCLSEILDYFVRASWWPIISSISYNLFLNY